MAGLAIPDTLKGRSLTRIAAWSPDELLLTLDLARELKVERARRKELRLLPGRTVGLVFRKPSTRTRISSEVGIAELGGMALYVPAADLQLACQVERQQQLVGAPGSDPREAPALERVGDAEVGHGLMVLRALLDMKRLIFYTHRKRNI